MVGGPAVNGAGANTAGLILLQPGESACFTMEFFTATNPLTRVIDVDITSVTPCVAENSRAIDCDNNLVPIQDVRPGLILQGIQGPVRINDVCRMKKIPDRLAYCEPGCFGQNSPGPNGLLIAESHPILLDGVAVTPLSLMQENHPGISMLPNSRRTPVYTLVTDQETFVFIDQVPVRTWSSVAWQEFITHSDEGRNCLYSLM